MAIKLKMSGICLKFPSNTRHVVNFVLSGDDCADLKSFLMICWLHVTIATKTMERQHSTKVASLT